MCRRRSFSFLAFDRPTGSAADFVFVLAQNFCCNGTTVEDEALGTVIQLQGDQRECVKQFLISQQLVRRENVKVHGF